MDPGTEESHAGMNGMEELGIQMEDVEGVDCACAVGC